jgi:hypothetical protein
MSLSTMGFFIQTSRGNFHLEHPSLLANLCTHTYTRERRKTPLRANLSARPVQSRRFYFIINLTSSAWYSAAPSSFWARHRCIWAALILITGAHQSYLHFIRFVLWLAVDLAILTIKPAAVACVVHLFCIQSSASHDMQTWRLFIISPFNFQPSQQQQSSVVAAAVCILFFRCERRWLPRVWIQKICTLSKCSTAITVH